MVIGQLGGDSSAGSSVQEAYLDEEGFVDFFDGVGFFCQSCCQGVQADRTSLIFLDDDQEEFAVDFVEAVAIYFEHLQGGLRCGQVDLSRASYLSVVADSA